MASHTRELASERPSSTTEASGLRLAITRLARRLRKHSGAATTPSQLSALTTLERRGRVRIGRLAELEGISKSTATRLTANLEAQGLVQRTQDADDARSWNVELAAAGVDLLHSSSERSDAYLTRQIDALTAADRRRLFAALPVLERLLESKA